MKVQEARKLTTEQKIKAIAEGRARLAEGHGGRYALVILEDERPQKAGVTRALESVRVLKAEAVEIFKAFGLPPNTRVCPPPMPAPVALTRDDLLALRALTMLAASDAGEGGDAESPEDEAKYDALTDKLEALLKINRAQSGAKE